MFCHSVLDILLLSSLDWPVISEVLPQVTSVESKVEAFVAVEMAATTAFGFLHYITLRINSGTSRCAGAMVSLCHRPSPRSTLAANQTAFYLWSFSIDI